MENLGHRDVSPPGHGSCGHVRVPQTGEAGLKCHHAVMGLERSCVSELVKGSVERHAKLLSRAVANCEERHDVTPAEAKTNKVRHQDILRRQGRVTGHTIVGAVGVEGPWVTVGREDLLSISRCSAIVLATGLPWHARPAAAQVPRPTGLKRASARCDFRAC